MNKKGLWLLLLIPVLEAAAANCTSAAVGTPTITPTAGKTTASLSAEPAWKSDWDKTVAAAKKEGQVTIYTTAGPSQTAALQEGFQKAYGINLEFLTGRGAELREKLFRERRAGLYLADMFMMGASGMILDLKPEGVLNPLIPQMALPEIVNTSAWYGGSHLYLDKERAYVIAFSFFPQPPMAINTDLVKDGDIKSHADLLNPRWKGKIVINDPTTTGSGQKWFHMAYKSLGPDYMRKLANQNPVITRDQRVQAEGVARGKYAALLGALTGAISEFMIAGAPMKYLRPPDVSYAGSGTGTMGLVNRPAHPNAAKVFINWFLSKEAQTVYSQVFLIQSARLDVATDHLDPMMVRQPGVVYMSSDDEEISLELNTMVKEATSIFGLGSR